MAVREVVDGDRAWVVGVLTERWGSTLIARRDAFVDASDLPGLIAEAEGERLGLATYQELDGEVELVTLDALVGSRGVGSALVQRLVELARQRSCGRVWLITTNDNLPALRFYGRRGFRIVVVHPGAVDRARLLKPGIPLIGLGGIEIHDEIELARKLRPGSAAAPAGTGTAGGRG